MAVVHYLQVSLFSLFCSKFRACEIQPLSLIERMDMLDFFVVVVVFFGTCFWFHCK